jgi:hypothetical protein
LPGMRWRNRAQGRRVRRLSGGRWRRAARIMTMKGASNRVRRGDEPARGDLAARRPAHLPAVNCGAVGVGSARARFAAKCGTCCEYDRPGFHPDDRDHSN